MKRALVLICVIAFALAGCATKQPATAASDADSKQPETAVSADASKQPETVVPADAAQTLLNEVTFRDTLMEAKGEIASDWYLLDDKVSEFSIYISGSGATAEEIAVIKSADVKTAKATVEKRVEDLKLNFENYVPAEMTKLSDPVIVTRGDVVFLVICDDSNQAKKAIDGLFK